MAHDPAFMAALPEHLRVLREGAERAQPLTAPTAVLRATLGVLLMSAEVVARQIVAVTGADAPRVPRRDPEAGDPRRAPYPHP